jgi:hypothetical protein
MLSLSFMSISLLVVDCTRRAPVALRIPSPQLTYLVALSGYFSRPYPLVEHEIQFKAVRNGAQVATGSLYSGDFMDDSFADAYRGHEWPRENVVQFLAVARHCSTVSDRVTIFNRTSRPVSAVKLKYIDLFLVFGLDPGSTVEVTVPGCPSADVYVAA